METPRLLSPSSSSSNSQGIKSPKRSLRFQTSISSLFDVSKSHSNSHHQPTLTSPSSTTLAENRSSSQLSSRTPAPNAAASRSITTILFSPPSKPQQQSPSSLSQHYEQYYHRGNQRYHSHQSSNHISLESSSIDPQVSRRTRSSEHLLASTIPAQMSYEVPPYRPMAPPPSHILSCKPSFSVPTPTHRFRRPLNGYFEIKKPLPPLPGPSSASSSSSRPTTPALSSVPSIRIEDSITVKPHNLSIIPEATTPVTPNAPVPALQITQPKNTYQQQHHHSLPEPELPIPVLSELEYEEEQKSQNLSISVNNDADPVELESPEPEFHFHASSRPDCAVCAQQDQFWGFGLGYGVDLPLTPPDTPESPAVERPGLRLSVLNRIPHEGRDITSWLALSPPSSYYSGSMIDDEIDDDETPTNKNEYTYDTMNAHFRLEQELRIVSHSGSKNSIKPPRTLLSLPISIRIRIFQSLDSIKTATTLAATHPELHDTFTSNKLTILESTIPRSLSLLISSTQQSYSTLSSYLSALRNHINIASHVKSLIRQRCRFFLSKKFLSPSSPVDDTAFSTALYRLWTFSYLFSASSSAARDFAAQTSWLRQQNLSMQQLQDILEVYQCIGALLCPLTSTSHVIPALHAGAVEPRATRTEMETALEMWVMQIQTLPLGRIVGVLERAENEEVGEVWREVERMGLAMEKGGKSRRMWLKQAVGAVFEELMKEERKRLLKKKWGEEGVWGETWET